MTTYNKALTSNAILLTVAKGEGFSKDDAAINGVVISVPFTAVNANENDFSGFKIIEKGGESETGVSDTDSKLFNVTGVTKTLKSTFTLSAGTVEVNGTDVSTVTVSGLTSSNGAALLLTDATWAVYAATDTGFTTPLEGWSVNTDSGKLTVPGKAAEAGYQIVATGTGSVAGQAVMDFSVTRAAQTLASITVKNGTTEVTSVEVDGTDGATLTVAGVNQFDEPFTESLTLALANVSGNVEVSGEATSKVTVAGTTITVPGNCKTGVFTITPNSQSGLAKNIEVTHANVALAAISLSNGTMAVPEASASNATVTISPKDQYGDDFAGSVNYSFTPANSGITILDNTITIAPSAAAAIEGTSKEYTIKANNSSTIIATLTVTRAASVATTVTVSGGQESILVPAMGATDNVSTAFTATVTDQYGLTMSNPSIDWTITSTTGVTIGSNGKVTVQDTAREPITDATGTELTVTATCGGKTGTATITVKRDTAKAGSIVFQSPQEKITRTQLNGADRSYTYTVLVNDQYDTAVSDANVAWSATGNATITTTPTATNSSGIATATLNAPTNTADSVTLTASVTVGGVTKSAQHAITVTNLPVPVFTDLSKTDFIAAAEKAYGDAAFIKTIALETGENQIKYDDNGDGIDEATYTGTVAYSVERVDGDTTTIVANVASVDSNTGEVTIKGVGSVKVVATAPAIDGKTEAATASYVLTVTPKTIPANKLTASGAGLTKTYDGTTTADKDSITVDIDGGEIVSGDSGKLSVTVSAAAFKSANAGNPKVELTIALAGAAKDNYQLAATTMEADGTIDKLGVTAAIGDIENVTYDKTEHKPTPTVTWTKTTGGDALGTIPAPVLGTDWEYKYESSNYTKAADGLKVNVKDASPASTNYTITPATSDATFDIAKKTVTVTDGDLVITKEYDGNTTVVTSGTGSVTGALGLSGVIAGDVVTVSGTYGNYASSDVNTTGVTVPYTGLTLGGTDKDNYQLASTDYNFTKATITKVLPKPSHFNVTAPTSLTYDKTAKEASVTTSEEGMGKVTVKYALYDTSTSSYGTPTTTAPVNAGKYKVYLAVAEGANFGATTADIATDTEFTIAKATRSLTVDPTSILLTPANKQATITASVTNETNLDNSARFTYTTTDGAGFINLSGAKVTGVKDTTSAVTVVVTVPETDNYEAKTANVSVEVVMQPVKTVAIAGDTGDNITATLDGDKIIIAGTLKAADENLATEVGSEAHKLNVTLASGISGTHEAVIDGGKLIVRDKTDNTKVIATYTIVNNAQVIATPDGTEITPQTPAASTNSTTADGVTEDDTTKTTLNSVAASGTASADINTTDAVEIAQKAGNAYETKVSADDKVALEAATTGGQTIKLETTVKTEVKITDAKEADGTKPDNAADITELTLDVTPRLTVQAKSGDGTVTKDVITEADDVKLTSLSTPMTVSVSTAGLAKFNAGGAKVFAKVGNSYTPVNVSANKATFTMASPGAVTLIVDDRAGTVTFKSEDGSDTLGSAYYDVTNLGESFSVANPTKSGYTFNGWFDGATKYSSVNDALLGAIKDGGGSLTLTAKFTQNSTPPTPPTPTITPGIGGGGYTPSSRDNDTTTYSIGNTTPRSEHGTVKFANSKVAAGKTATITVTPDAGYELGELTVTDAKGNAIRVTRNADGTYSFTMPASSVKVNATFVPEGSQVTAPNFIDVPAYEFYADPVAWAVKNGITNGTSPVTFSPNDPCTRGQVVTFLYRAAGSPEVEPISAFVDVPANEYYAKAVAWAVANGITNGKDGLDTFKPDDACTRAEIVTFLARFEKASLIDANTRFEDVPATEWYAGAVAWAVNSGITTGTSTTTFSPNDVCTRGQVVTFLYRDFATK